MKLGIVGTGDLAESMVKIILKNKAATGSNISVYETDADILNYWAGTYDVVPCDDLETVIKSSEILFIAVGGQGFLKVIANADFLLKTYRPLVVVLSKGLALEQIEDMMNFITPMARVSTNLNIGIGAGITAYCFNELATDEQKGTLVELFSGAGQLVEIEEELFDSFAAISSVSSLCACAVAEIVSYAGLPHGMPTDVALKTALHCMYGTLKLMLETNSNPHEQIKKLCPPLGGTSEALLKIKENGFDQAIIKAFSAAMENKY